MSYQVPEVIFFSSWELCILWLFSMKFRFIATSDSYAMSQIIDVTGDATPPNMSFGFDKLVML